MNPFRYPDAPHVRRHGPKGYATAESYRPWLRDEFAFRCVYCLAREGWGKFRGEFAVEHFRPLSRYPELSLDYDNFLYACITCNAVKGSRETHDPLGVLLSESVAVSPEGELRTCTPEAGQLVERLDLNQPRLVEFRRLWIEVVRMAERFDPGFLMRVLGYPEDLPDLKALHPPGGNGRPDGVNQSHAERRIRGELPAIY